jgi:hypothetical protein
VIHVPEFLLEAARELSAQLAEDIPLCRTREEHIRVTARANAAAALYNSMMSTDEEEDLL